MDLEIQIGQFLEKIGQISVWLQAIGLTGLDDAVNRGTGFCSFGRSAEQPVLPAYGEVPDGPFTDIVRHGSFSIFQVGTQLLPVEENILDGLAQRRLQARLLIHFRFQPRKVSLQLAFFKPQTFFFPFFRIQFCQFLIFGKDFPQFLDGLAAGGLGYLFLGHVCRDGIDEVPPGVHPAQSMDFAGDLFISCIPIGLQDSLIPLQELPGELTAPALAVLVDPYFFQLFIFPIGIHSHEGLGGVLPVLLIQHLDRSFVRMDHRLLQQLSLHDTDQGRQPVLGRPDDPVGHGCPGKGQADILPFLFLPVEWHGHLVFLDDDMGYGRSGGHGVLQDAVRHLRLLNHKMFLLPAFQALERFPVDVDDLDLGRDELHFRADLLFAHGDQGTAAALADPFIFRESIQFFLHGGIFPAARPNPASASCAVCGPGLRFQVPAPMVWLPLRLH